MWSKDIDSARGTFRNKFYPGRRMVSVNGYYHAEPAMINFLSLAGYNSGFTCPHCGETMLDFTETYTSVKFETYPVTGHPLDPYIETCVRGKCGHSWEIRARTDGQAIITYISRI